MFFISQNKFCAIGIGQYISKDLVWS